MASSRARIVGSTHRSDTDANDRGEVKVILVNRGAAPFPVRRGDRIARRVSAPVLGAASDEVDALRDTVRIGGGFGSTGR